ncbi:hypothetical protein HGG76_27015 [Ochrobactrum tritici]|uniref:Uncharacterized protein n=1 Tax=Brucella tritici TaxID=94626 RepID=A0A7X6FSQ6_9HYPH|nr:hypothetical protein [Brucella tritici]
MGAAMYQVHLDRQDELAKSYTAAEKLGDKELANTIRDRQEYESLAYERDRGMSYLSTCEALYGRESKQFKEQEVDVKELASQADRAHEKMMESHRILKERDQSQKSNLSKLSSRKPHRRRILSRISKPMNPDMR